ncbi:MAG: AraC-like DNA-binding protein [Zhongshania aliphaticivorans]|jgi:AraC-like DNA-binding protein|uniref:AraC-like DNA-binding protein n=1 Tax=Zhongshania antarctica TaxID=641702 RepID=A0A840R0S2_9GAMM|nr:AraC family transcriptional regulator [Zhongshania antarctica]MBB5186100.1 AraC-like DNA-binding protein [Zhongshania antarctica]
MPVSDLPAASERAVNSSAFKALFQAAEALGADITALFSEMGVTLSELEDSDRRYPVGDLFRLYELVAQKVASPDIGLYIGRIDYVNRLNLQLYACSACTTFREYLNVMPSVLRIVGDIGEVKVRREGEFIRLDWQPLAPESAIQRYLSDSSLSVAAAIVNSVCVRPIPIRAAHFSYAEPADLNLLKQQFGDCLRFDQPTSCVYLDRACLDYALIKLDANWVQALAQPIRYLFEDNSDSNDFIVAVRKTLLRLLPSGDMNIDKAAEALNISRRTLQRRLAEQGTQFLQVLQELRAELAIQYLSDERLSITDIAFLLGYMDQSSFSGAFRSWHGQSPRDYRKK